MVLTIYFVIMVKISVLGSKQSVSLKILFVCKDVGGKIAETVFTKLATNKLTRQYIITDAREEFLKHFKNQSPFWANPQTSFF